MSARDTGVGSGREIGAVIASRAAFASSTVVAYRWPGSLAIPFLMTASNFSGISGRVLDGRGGGVVRCAATWLSRLSPGNGGLAGQAFKQRAGQRVDVGSGVDLAGAQPLGCDVLPRCRSRCRSSSMGSGRRRGRSRNR